MSPRPPAKSVAPLRVCRSAGGRRDARPQAGRAVAGAVSEATEARRRVHREDQGVHAGSAHQHGARRSPPGVGHGSHAAEVLRPHARHARRADLREGHPALLRGARQGVGPHHDVDDRQDRRRPRHGAARGGRRGDDQADRQVQGHARVADRSAQDDRGAGAAADSAPPSRSTGSRAACTRARPAAPRCCSSCRTGSRSKRRRSSRPSATTSSRSSRRSSRSTAARSTSTPTTSTRSVRRPKRGCR